MHIWISSSLLGFVLLASTALADEGVVRLSEPVNETSAYEDFGAVLPENEALHSLDEAISRLGDLAVSRS